jgi:BASS family bile acid:Na+ symporter
MELLSKAVPVTMLTFVVSSMLAVGLSLSVTQILGPLRNLKLVSLALVANFILIPMSAYGIAWLLRLDEPLGVALILLGTAAGAPFLPLLARLSKGNIAFSVGLMVLLMIVSVGYMPLVLPFLLKGVSVDPLQILRSLVLLMMLPLAIGLVVKARFSSAAAKIQPPLSRIASLTLILLIGLLLVTNIQNVISLFGTRGVLASVVFLAVASAIGWLMGGADATTKPVMALGTAQRNIAAALVVGGQNFTDPRVVVMIVVVAIVGLLLLMPLARFFGTKAEASASAPEVVQTEQEVARGAGSSL